MVGQLRRQDSDLTGTYRSTSYLIIKWFLIAMIVLNILSSIWVGIYMENHYRRVKSIDDRQWYNWDSPRFDDKDFKHKADVWKGVVITVLVISDLVCLLGIFGVLREHYCLTMVFGVLMLVYAIFSCITEYMRRSISAWVVSFSTGIIAFLFGHKIRVEVIHPTIYSSPIND